MEAVGRVLERVDQAPEQFLIVHRRFPYAIFFAQEEADRVVLAILHQAVDSARWPK